MKRNQVIDDGRVRCPVRNEDVELDRCVRCSALADLELDSIRPHVVCEYDAPHRGWLTSLAEAARDLRRELRVQQRPGRRHVD